MAKKRSSAPQIDFIRCERCGEDYAAIYKRCPFCDWKPGKEGGDSEYGRRVPLQAVLAVFSLAVTVAALCVAINIRPRWA